MAIEEQDRDGLQKAWAALRHGEEQGCEVLFRACYADLFGYGLKLVGDRELVQDSIQNLFATLWRTRTRLGPAASVQAYLLSALRRMLLREVERKRRREEHRMAAAEPRIAFSHEELIVRLEVTEAQQQALLDSLNCLSPRQREVVYLRYYNGLTNAEIAEVLGLEHQTVRNHLTRALSHLREQCRRRVGKEFAATLLLALELLNG